MAKLKKIFTKDFRAHRAYFAMLENKKIRDRQILAESMHGVTIGGNIEKILELLTLDEEFSAYTLFLGVNPELFEQVKKKKEQVARLRKASAADTVEKGGAESFIDWGRITPVIIGSKEYFEALATSKYLINDTTFVHSFIKREGQVYLNTWHGTPLKNLGKAVERERFSMGNVQKNFFASDVILFPNEHTERVICRDYYLNNFCTAHVARTGYPRNEVFFDEELRLKLRKQLGFEGKRVYAYLPTWRGNMGKVEKQQKDFLKKQLSELDSMLVSSGYEKEIVIYVKLHPMLSDVMDTGKYHCIKSYSSSIAPLYAFLQATDGLITDYSSILFDYALTGRDILIYTYDEEEYTRTHGLYMGLEELPFSRVHTAKELAERIWTHGDGVVGSKDFVDSFCPYDSPNTAKKLLHDLISGGYKNYPTVSDNGKKNVLIYGGDFVRNGITVSLLNLLKNLDTGKKNYMVLYEMKEGLAYEPALTEIPEGIAVLGASPVRVQTIGEVIRTKGWEKLKTGRYKNLRKYYHNIGCKEAAKIFGSSYISREKNTSAANTSGLKMDCAVHFTGYSPLFMLALESLSCPRTVFVHNDMMREAQKPYAMPSELVADMYCSYDKVALITEGQRQCTEEFIGKYGGALSREAREKTLHSGLCVIPNVFDYEQVEAMAGASLSFDEETCSTHTSEALDKILNGNARVLINIGRFSPEKGQLRLIDAFERAVDESFFNNNLRVSESLPAGTKNPSEKKNPDNAEIPYLIILGSYGPLYDRIMERAKGSKYASNIVIIKAMRNPYPLLKHCSLFVLSSVYEGLPLTIMEADTLKVPCISTSVGAGPAEFMRSYGGRLVKDSTEGICDGLTEYLRGNVPGLLTADYRKMKEAALKRFDLLVEGKETAEL